MPSPPFVVTRSRSLSRGTDRTGEVSPTAKKHDVRHVPKIQATPSPRHSYREIRVPDSPKQTVRQTPISEPGQSVHVPVVMQQSRTPSPGTVYSVPSSPLLGSRSSLPAPSTSHSVPNSPSQGSRSSLPARVVARQDSSLPAPKMSYSLPTMEQQPRSASVENATRPPEGHVQLQEMRVLLSRLKHAGSHPQTQVVQQGRSLSPEAKDHGPLSFGHLLGAEGEQDGLLSEQPPARALQMELQELISILEQQHRPKPEGKMDLSDDDEQRIKLQVRRVHEVASAAPESQIRTFCATIACQQAQLELSLQMLRKKMNAMQQQVQDALRSMSLSPGSSTPKQESRQESMLTTVRETDLVAAIEDAVQAVESKIAQKEEALKDWFAECCILTMKETFGCEMQRHEDAINFLKTRVRASSEKLASLQTSFDTSVSLDSIAELPDQDSDVPEGGRGGRQVYDTMLLRPGALGYPPHGAAQQLAIMQEGHKTELPETQLCSERFSKSDVSTYPLSLEVPTNDTDICTDASRV
mmetsp:Transcript_40474/g.75848  ORF Transcript_40474/g.75848 Transcript_40474/m.75848 type:complete len:525 (+) Transcript_40474:73-1647(+)